MNDCPIREISDVERKKFTENFLAIFQTILEVNLNNWSPVLFASRSCLTLCQPKVSTEVTAAVVVDLLKFHQIFIELLASERSLLYSEDFEVSELEEYIVNLCQLSARFFTAFENTTIVCESILTIASFILNILFTSNEAFAQSKVRSELTRFTERSSMVPRPTTNQSTSLI